MNEINFSQLCNFHDKQWLATETADRHRYTLYGGSRGPGKSYWLRWYLLRRLIMYAGRGLKNVDVMLACEDYPSLKGRQINKIAKEFPPFLGQLKDTKEKGLGFHLYPAYGSGSILLRNLDDASKYQSFEFADIGVDELTKNTEDTFNILRGSLRWPGIDDGTFTGATNPAANWVRDYWIERRLPDEMKDRADMFAFVSALPDDNPHLSDAYWNELNSLSGALRDAWLFGDWYASVEGLVFDDFNDDNKTDQEPDLDRPFELGIDEGYIHPRAILFIQRTDTHVLVFDEIYETHQLEEEAVREILYKCVEHHCRLKGVDFSSVWPQEERLTNTELSGKLQAAGVRLPDISAVAHEAVALRRRLKEADIAARNWMSTKVAKGSTRIEAIKRTRELIKDGKGYRAILVHRRCKNLLDEIQMGYKYPEGQRKLDEKPLDENDHACEALENWVWMRMRRG